MIDLVAERFHLQQPKPPCDQIIPATFCSQSATSRRPPCNHPATSLRPPEILVARRSPTGCKLCVTEALPTVMAAPFTMFSLNHFFCQGALTIILNHTSHQTTTWMISITIDVDNYWGYIYITDCQNNRRNPYYAQSHSVSTSSFHTG